MKDSDSSRLNCGHHFHTDVSIIKLIIIKSSNDKQVVYHVSVDVSDSPAQHVAF